MARLDTTNVMATHFGGGHIESVIGKLKTGDKDDKQVQVGYVGKIGALVRENIYEFLPLAIGDPLYVITTPEVNVKDDSIIDRKIVNFVLEAGEVVDAVPIAVTDKISISEDGIVGEPTVKGYLYTKAGEDKFQYSEIANPSDAIHTFKIESIENATQRMVIGLGNTQMKLQYKMIKARRIA